MIPDPADANPSDNMLGLLFSRIFHLRTELGEQAYERSLRALLVALGASALAEAERLARAFEGRTGRRPTDLHATPWTRRTTGEPLDESIEP